MKKTARIIGSLLAIVMLLSIAACSGKIEPSKDPPAVNPSPSATPTINPSSNATPDEPIVPVDIHLTAGGTVIGGDPSSGNYTVMSARGPVYAQEFEPSYAQPKRPGTIATYTNQLARLDPAHSNQTEHGWCYNVYEPLFEPSQDVIGEFVPVLATEWYFDNDGNFHAILREGVKFHDGSGTMTAEDVLYSIERVVNSPTSPASESLQGVDIENSYAENDYHIVIKFKGTCGGFMNLMGCSWLSVVSKKTFEEMGPDYDWWNKSAGTGAYYCVETITALSQTFKRFDEYWGGKPVMDTIILMSQIESTVMGIEVENGDFEIGLQCNLETIERVLNGEVSGLDYLLLSTHRSFHIRPATLPESKAFSDVRVREAFSMSINRDDIVMAVYGSPGLGRPSNKQMIDGIDVGVPEYNPDKAREIMSELGYGPDNKLTVELMSSSTQAFQAMTEAIQGMVNECYFDAKISITASGAVTEDSYSKEFPAKWDGIMAGYQLLVDAEIFFREDMNAYGKQPGEFSAQMGVDDEEYSRLRGLLSAETDPVERGKIIDELNILYQKQFYYIPLIINYQPMVAQNYLQNIVFRDGLGIVWKALEYKDWVDYTA